LDGWWEGSTRNGEPKNRRFTSGRAHLAATFRGPKPQIFTLTANFHADTVAQSNSALNNRVVSNQMADILRGKLASMRPANNRDIAPIFRRMPVIAEG
jgi:hypothetical protein